MKRIFLFSIVAAGLWFAGCNDAGKYTTEAECKQTLCTQEHCYVWSAELNRCGTADALRKEENRLKKKLMRAEKKDSAKVVLPKSVQDSLAKIDKRKSKLKKEIKDLRKEADSLQVVDSIAGNHLLASAYLKAKLEAEKVALDKKYKALMDSVEILNLVNRKQITALQWLEYNKRIKKSKLDKLEPKK